MSDANKHPAIFIQDACFQHQYIRSRDLSAIVERPERLRAVAVGLAAAIARFESTLPSSATSDALNRAETEKDREKLDPDDLVIALGRMNLVHNPLQHKQPSPVSIVKSQASVDLLNHSAVKYIHGDLEGDVYLGNLKGWARDSWEKIHQGSSEIPEGLSQGDLYRA